MLYDQWERTARAMGGETALVEVASNRSWTFRQLFDRGEAEPAVGTGILWAHGHGPEFVFQVLQSWRTSRVLGPLDQDHAVPIAVTPPSGCALLKTTSATTGAPRYIAFTETQLAADASAIVQTMGLHPGIPNLGVISLAHSYGFSSLVLPLLLHGIPLVLAPSALPEMLRRVGRLRTEWVLPAVPALWRAWHEAGSIPDSVRLAISAGAPLPLPLEQQVFERWNLKLHNFLGASECGGIAFDPDPQPRADVGLAGVPLHGVEVLIQDGCLAVRSPAVGSGYWPDPDVRLGTGSFRTTDLAELRDGRVYLRGRAADLINVAGRKLNPLRVEDALSGHPSVRECLVLGMPSGTADRGDTVAAVVVPRHAVTHAELRDFLMHQLPSWQVPRHWHLVESLERNHRGKLSRTQWRERLTRALGG